MTRVIVAISTSAPILAPDFLRNRASSYKLKKRLHVSVILLFTFKIRLIIISGKDLEDLEEQKLKRSRCGSWVFGHTCIERDANCFVEVISHALNLRPLEHLYLQEEEDFVRTARMRGVERERERQRLERRLNEKGDERENASVRGSETRKDLRRRNIVTLHESGSAEGDRNSPSL